MPGVVIVFLAVAIGVLFGFQYFLYFSATRLLRIDSWRVRRTLLCALLFLLAGVVGSMFLQRRVDADWSRAVAGTFQLSMAVGLNLALAFLLAWAVVGVTRLAGARVSRAALGWCAVVLAVLASGYGIWNALNPRVRHVTVRMKDLPPAWHGQTIAQITDLHLGFSVGRRFAEEVVAMVNAERPAAVVITGDLFDGADTALNGLADALNGLQAPKGVYFVTGNHETYVGLSLVREALRGTRVRMLDDEMATLDGLQVVGIAYPDRMASKDLGAAIRSVPGFDPARASVLLWHSPVQIPAVKAAGIRLQLSGHTHRGQLFPFQFITRRVYGPYDYGLTQEDGFAIYTSPGTGTWGPRMRTTARAEITVVRLEPR